MNYWKFRWSLAPAVANISLRYSLIYFWLSTLSSNLSLSITLSKDQSLQATSIFGKLALLPITTIVKLGISDLLLLKHGLISRQACRSIGLSLIVVDHVVVSLLERHLLRFFDYTTYAHWYMREDKMNVFLWDETIAIEIITRDNGKRWWRMSYMSKTSLNLVSRGE